MCKRLFYLIFAILILLPASTLAKPRFTIVIDPGHGGGDVGTPHRKQKLDEKTIALNVSLKLGAMIEANHKDVKVVYTRKTDIYPTLPDRTKIANKAKGDLFISVHVNAAENSTAKGFETYVFGITGLAGKSESEQKRIRQRTMQEVENIGIDGKVVDFEKTVDQQTRILCQMQREKHNKYSAELADFVQENMISNLRKSSYRNKIVDRGVKQKNIYVLCYSNMPAILVEIGYMSNPDEERFIGSAEGQELFARSLYQAFARYKNNWEKRQLDGGAPTTIIPETPVETEPEPLPEPVVETVQQPEVQTKPEEAAQKKQEVEAQRKQEEAAQTKQEATDGAAVAEPAPQPNVKEGPYYAIQFLTSSTPIPAGSPLFKGLSPVSSYQDRGIWKYIYGHASSPEALKSDLAHVKKSFKDAFIVGFDTNGKRIK